MDEPEFIIRGERAALAACALQAKLAREQYPHCRKVGRYAFFALCSLGVVGISGVAMTKWGMGREWASQIGGISGMIAFLALRDMSKAWDLAVYAAAEVQAHADELASRPRGDA